MHTITDEHTDVIDRPTGLTKTWRLTIHYNQDFSGLAHVHYEHDDLIGSVGFEHDALELAHGRVDFFGTFLPVKAQLRLVAIMATRRLRDAVEAVLDDLEPDNLAYVRHAIETAIPRALGTPP